MMGAEAANKMLKEGWKPTAQEAEKVGMYIVNLDNLKRLYAFLSNYILYRTY